MVATLIVWMAFAAAIVSTYAYVQSATKKKMLVPLARRSFLVMAAGVVAASVLLMVFILRHQFEYAYIWSYSSRELPTHLLLTTFWAGQEGSFLFWTLCSTIIGFALLNYTRRKRIEYETMAVYTLLQAFLLLLLVAKSPFKFIWDAYPADLTPGSIPPDGRGLNPLLQNFWMIIHPPVMFIGFAAMGVPFSLAVSALWRKTYGEWISSALPWSLFAAVSLGAGLIIGGYWAYGVLGWGGWWGWDPVENSSLVPWIIVIALLHTLIVQKKTGKLLRTNFVLAIIGFLLVIYSTFLTRSGILGSASVHSFTDPGSLVYALLVVWIGTLTILGFTMLGRRWNELRQVAQGVGSVTRESLISMGAAAMGASAAIILFGTSWPIVAEATVEPSFYDNMNLPIAVFLAVVLGLSLLVQWRSESLTGLLRRALVSLLTAAVAGVVLFLLGMKDGGMLALAIASIFALAVNLKRGVQLARQNPKLLGGVLSHTGLALLFLGIIASGRYGQKQTASLPLGEPKELFGHTVTYTGSQQVDGKFQFLVRAEKNGSSFLLTPVMFRSTYNNSLMREPDYRSFLRGDFYLEPVSLETTPSDDAGHVYTLAREEPLNLGNAVVTFRKFDMGRHGSEGMKSGSGFVVGAVVEITRDKTTETVTVRSVFNQGAEPVPTASETKDGKFRFRLMGMNIDMENGKSVVAMEILDADDPHDHASHAGAELLVVEASVKPFMSVVWLAAALILGGMIVSLMNREEAPRPPRKSNGELRRRDRRPETRELVEQQ